MNLYNMTRPEKCYRLKFACTRVYHTLVVYYHAYCSIAYLACQACCADMGGIVFSSDSEDKKMLDSTRKRVGHGREREVGERENRNEKR